MSELLLNPRDTWTAAKIRHLLQERHAAPEWAFFSELPDRTGFDQVRTFDAWAMAVWPSLGFKTVGYEIKVSRADFAREVLKPTKRTPMEQVSNECFFATPAGLLKPDEVPEGWGLIEATGGEEPKLRVKKHAQSRTIDPLPPGFIASLARRSSDPPPPLPVAAWRTAGRVLTLADLDRLVTARLKGMPNLERVELERLRERDRLRDERAAHAWALVTVIREVLGWQAGRDPDTLRSALLQRPKATPAERLRAMARELDDIAHALPKETP